MDIIVVDSQQVDQRFKMEVIRILNLPTFQQERKHYLACCKHVLGATSSLTAWQMVMMIIIKKKE